MELLRLGVGDEAKACEVAAVFRSSEVSRDHMSAFLANDANYLMAAYVDDELAGYALGYAMQRIGCEQNMMCLYEIEVVARHRRKGIGRALVNALAEVCKEKGFLKMWLITQEDNTAAKGLYAATGGQRGGASEAPVCFWWQWPMLPPR